MECIVMKVSVLIFLQLIGVCEGCDSGYYADTSKCLPCPENCIACSSASSCDSCRVSYYGESCSQVCPDHCHDNECNKTSGLCITCSKGYYSGENKSCIKCPENCTTCNSPQYCFACKSGYKGNACEDRCTTCRPGTSCDKQTGYCLESCRAGLSGDLCTINCDDKCTFCERSNERACISCAHNRFGDSCNNICSKTCLNQTCRDSDGVCTYGEEEENPPTYECHSSTGKTAATTAALIVGLLEPIIIFAIIIVIVCRKKIRQYIPCTFNWRNSVEDRLSNLRKRFSPSDGIMEPESSPLTSQETTSKPVPNTSQSGSIEDINTVEEEEEDNIETNVVHENEPSRNMSDNRLERTDTENKGNEKRRTATLGVADVNLIHSNASKWDYITMFESIEELLKKETEIWRIVWDAGCFIIVMLTSFLEIEDVCKFDQFLLCSKQDSDINITFLCGYNRANYAVRKFKLKTKQNNEERVVWLFRFVTWPDKWGAEDIPSLLEFNKEVNSVKSGVEGPILVHSSTEVHRCATYIALTKGKDRNEEDVRVCLRYPKSQRLERDADETEYLTRMLFQPPSPENIQHKDKSHKTWTSNVATFRKIDKLEKNDWPLPKS